VTGGGRWSVVGDRWSVIGGQVGGRELHARPRDNPSQ
jgi:hypothetical protein